MTQVALFVVQVSILLTVFAFGLSATTADVLYVVHRPGLFARSLLAMFVVMPVVAITLVQVMDLPAATRIVLVALAISPVPPLLPQRETTAGGSGSFGLGLMATLALVSIAVVPAAVEILGRVLDREVGTAPSAIAGLVLKAALVPLAAGMIVRALTPGMAARLERIVSLVAKVILTVGLLAVLWGILSAVWTVLTPATFVALAIFIVAGLAMGHLLGGPDPHHAAVLALSTACRHPAIALTIAASNFPDLKFGATILLYLLMNLVVAIPYVIWRRRLAAR